MKAREKKTLGPTGPSLLDKSPREVIYTAMNQVAIKYMQQSSGGFQTAYGRLLDRTLQKSTSFLKESVDAMHVIFGEGSDFRKDMAELKQVTSEISDGIRYIAGNWWKDVKNGFRPDNRRLDPRESKQCETDAIRAFTEATDAAHASISRGGYDVGPVSKEFMAVSYAHDVMDAAESCVGVEQKMADSTAVSYVAQRSASDGYVLSSVQPGDSYSDVQQAFQSEIKRTGERTFADCMADAVKIAQERARRAPVTSHVVSSGCQHNLRGLELRDSSDGLDRSCTF